jgi:hypothetical protein
MTDAPDKDKNHDQTLENYLRGESALSQQYDAASTETPAAEIDARVLAAARRAVHAGPAPMPARKKSWQWQIPLATAAVIVLGVTITLQIAEQEIHQQPVTGGTVAPGAVEAKRANEQFAPAVETDDRKNRLDAGALNRLQEKKAIPAPAGSVAAPAALPVSPEIKTGSLAQPFRDESLSKDAWPAPELLREDNAPAMKQRAESARSADESAKAKLEQRASSPVSSSRAAPPAPAGPQSSAEEEPVGYKTPESWLEHVRELRRTGKSAEADASLARFKKIYPGYVIPADLR